MCVASSSWELNWPATRVMAAGSPPWPKARYCTDIWHSRIALTWLEEARSCPQPTTTRGSLNTGTHPAASLACEGTFAGRPRQGQSAVPLAFFLTPHVATHLCVRSLDSRWRTRGALPPRRSLLAAITTEHGRRRLARLVNITTELLISWLLPFMSHKAQLKEKRETFAAHGRAGPPTPCRLRCAQRVPEISDDCPPATARSPSVPRRHDTNTIRQCHAGAFFLAGDQPVGSTCRAADHNLVWRSGAEGKVEPTYPKRYARLDSRDRVLFLYL
jgi:hypothetical protein